MSIIEQALRLAQHKAKQAPPPAPTTPPPPPTGAELPATIPTQTGIPPAGPPGGAARPPQKSASLSIPPWLLPTLGVLIVLWVIPNVLLRPRRLPATPLAPTPAPQLSAPAAESSAAPSNTLLDQAPRPTLKVEGIVSGMGTAVAIINGYTVREGDTIGGALVTKIGRDSVTVVWRDREMTLRPRE